MILADAEHQEVLEEHGVAEAGPIEQRQVLGRADPPIASRARRIAIIVLTVVLATALCATVAAAFARGSWWYFNMTDRPLSTDARARLQAIRDDLAAMGTATAAVGWLDAALDPSADPTAVLARLEEAREILAASGDTALVGAAEEVGAIIQTVGPRGWGSEGTPRPVSTLESAK
jgi:hypothetical protein